MHRRTAGAYLMTYYVMNPSPRSAVFFSFPEQRPITCNWQKEAHQLLFSCPASTERGPPALPQASTPGHEFFCYFLVHAFPPTWLHRWSFPNNSSGSRLFPLGILLWAQVRTQRHLNAPPNRKWRKPLRGLSLNHRNTVSFYPISALSYHEGSMTGTI